jgi:hypothetical protein
MLAQPTFNTSGVINQVWFANSSAGVLLLRQRMEGHAVKCARIQLLDHIIFLLEKIVK